MNNNRSNIDKILNSIDDEPKNLKKPTIVVKPAVQQPNRIVEQKTNEQPIIKKQESTAIETLNYEDIQKRADEHFGSTSTSLVQGDSSIKVKKSVNSVLEEINRRTYVQTMSKDKKQFSKTFNIKVIGIGGAGNNIVKYMKTSQEWPDFVQIIALNTDYVALSAMGDLTDIFILGAKELDGNGSGGDPQVGEMAATADSEIIKDMLKGTDILILTAGLGKGTGTGATPVIAKIAQELGILTIGLFNLPSIGAEGNKTYSNALTGLQKLSSLCNGLTTVNNDKIIGVDKERTSIKKAFQGANKYIKTIFEEIINIIVKPSDINVDFADVKNFFQDKNGFLFMRVDLTDYTKDAIKEGLEYAIKTGFTDINIKESPKALLNFKLNENVPSVILENTRTALKEIVGANNINIVHGVSYNDVFENAEINVLLTGTFDLGSIDEDYDNSLERIPSSLSTSTLSDEFESEENEETKDDFSSLYGKQNNERPSIDYFDKFASNNNLFSEDEDEEDIDNFKYGTTSLTTQVNRVSSTTKIDDLPRKTPPQQKKKKGFFSKLFSKKDKNNEAY
ncbi:cell division protein FtsZ [Malacoplasma iowae]|uniref:Cell division protein FtsZ n=1 Tax=Malacoplasma iowae 695 TaxID=1048830 RepID=A0A6P1LD17_MALIO|nr:cell division protein FtsZ [Malacoplasma iowae]VEU63447.1 cell division protein FtsZ [Mycoplasmopsis fermentans]EGZ31071.1 cell division protein FtsZ [Malacoplasma iowae 695]QHG90286.2 cell division FtsZ family protein [Malacoplasma iowae 695]WPL35528.1 cell division protein FtsZ [Malacoplasma iowae]VEU72169.1 cell division protein FtsZ [Malacoplasma iowae]